MKNRVIIAASLALTLISQNALAGSIADTYAAGDTLTAVKMGNIKTAVNGNNAVNGTQTTAITVNTATNTTQTTNIGANATAIGTNATDIGTNATDIGTNATDIGTNATDIGTNATDIGTNATDIGTNAAGIATNAADIITNAADINTNAIEIARALAGVGSDFGIKTNVTLASLTSAGWTECFNEAFNLTTTTVASVLSTCNQANLMLACRLIATPTAIILAASAPRADVTFDTTTDTTTTHYANGAEWYFNDTRSWGFALAGDSVSKSSCDVATENPTYRMCIHTGTGNLQSGYRCGTNFVNGSTTYERVFLHKN